MGWTFPDRPVADYNITSLITGGSFQDVDVSTKVPAGTTAIIIRTINNNASTQYKAFVRPKGSSEDRSASAILNTGYKYAYNFVKLDGDRKFNGYFESVAAGNLTVYIVAYTNEAAAQFALTSTSKPWNGTDPSSPTFADVDYSAITDAGAKAVFYECAATGTTVARPKGNSWNNPIDLSGAANLRGNPLFIVGLDANRKGEGWTQWFLSNVDVVWGWTPNYVALDSFISKTPGSADTWAEVDLSGSVPAGATGVLLCSVNSAGSSPIWGARKFGVSSPDTERWCETDGVLGGHVVVGISSDRKIELNVDNISSKPAIYVIGYFTSGTPNYSRGAVDTLPTTDADLGTIITDRSPLASADGNRIGQAASGQYAVFLFKDTVTASSVTLTFTGRADLAPSSSSVVLQVYKYSGDAPLGWQTPALATESSVGADTDFTLSANIPDTTNYLSSGVMAHRVYQLMT